MYRIDVIDPQVVNDYADETAKRLKPLIDAYLDNQVLTLPVDGQNVNIAVCQGSLTEKVLTYLSDSSNLKSFLALDVKGQYNWVRDLQKDSYPNDFIFKKLGKTTYQKHIQGNPPFIDHFNEIMYDIFVTNGYEVLVDKTAFISNTYIEVCPYGAPGFFRG